MLHICICFLLRSHSWESNHAPLLLVLTLGPYGCSWTVFQCFAAFIANMVNDSLLSASLLICWNLQMFFVRRNGESFPYLTLRVSILPGYNGPSSLFLGCEEGKDCSEWLPFYYQQFCLGMDYMRGFSLASGSTTVLGLLYLRSQMIYHQLLIQVKLQYSCWWIFLLLSIQ